jgi:hypothetical protein
MAYLWGEQERIQRDQGVAFLAKCNLEHEEAAIKERLRVARVFLQLAPHLDYDCKPGEVPAQLTYSRLTNRGPRYENASRSMARLA